MAKLSEKIEAEKENINRTLANLKDVIERDEKSVVEPWHKKLLKISTSK